LSIIAENVDLEDKKRRSLGWRFNRFLERILPADLYRRALIIVIAPMVLLQSIMAGIFMDRHLDNVTKALSRTVARDMAFVLEVYENSPRTAESNHWLETVANQKLALGLKIEADSQLPPPAPKPFFSLLDSKLSKYVARYIGKPFWLDTLGQSGFVDVRIQASDGVIFRFLTDQDRR
jgi:two-component system osmolarity sensor histidine kinase EnvZ